MTKAAVIGSGFVGRAWAISFARAGCEVALWDEDKAAPPKAQTYVERLLPDLEEADLLNRSSASEVAARIRVATTLESALEGAVHVQENTPEDVEVKRTVFARLDSLAPPAGSIVPSAATSKTAPERINRNYEEDAFRQMTMQMGSWAEQRFAQSDPRAHARFHVELGKELQAHGFNSEAEAEFRHAAAIDPSSSGARLAEQAQPGSQP